MERLMIYTSGFKVVAFSLSMHEICCIHYSKGMTLWHVKYSEYGTWTYGPEIQILLVVRSVRTFQTNMVSLKQTVLYWSIAMYVVGLDGEFVWA